MLDTAAALPPVLPHWRERLFRVEQVLSATRLCQISRWEIQTTVKVFADFLANVCDEAESFFPRKRFSAVLSALLRCPENRRLACI